MNDISNKKADPKSDVLFKKVFSSKGNEHILAGLFEDFFGFKPIDLRLTNPYNIDLYWQNYNDPEKAEQKPMYTIDDISAEFNAGDLVAEMQIRAKNVFEPRALFNTFHSFNANYNKNDDRYESLRSVYSLNILFENLYKDDAAVREFVMRDKHTNRKMSKEFISVGFFELTKKNVYNKNQRYWQLYFLNEPIPKKAPDYIKDAAKQIEWVNLREEERKMLDRYERAQADYEAEMATVIRRAKAEAEAEAEAKHEADKAKALAEANADKAKALAEANADKAKAVEKTAEETTMSLAKSMKNDGMDSALIAKYTGLSLKQVEAL